MEKDYFVLGNAYKNVLGKKTINNEYKMDTVDLSNANDSHSIIVNHIIKDNQKKTILDVGANTGVLGSTLINYNSTIDGVEYDEDFFKKLKKNDSYKNVYNFSICDFDNKFYKDKTKYDYIIFADVLEHLTNPDEVIYNITKKLNKDGKIIISIPNIAHLDVIIQLINGNFNYNNEGILDSTHLRFFTHNSFVEMIDNIEEKNNIYFDVKKIGETKVLPPYANAIDTSLFNMNDNLYDYSIVQNIYELKIVNKKQKRNVKKIDLYRIMNDNYNGILEQKLNVEKENLRLLEENGLFENEINKQQEELNRIKNTLRYKIFFRIMEKLRK